ncbi:hypothetical protein K438DRAFT_1977028 [Mycena galopus ATCC 62051]|nr:hypothetical protein K438DRAFT_1977028 [Mycena galopus ATCC 62051]
MPIGIKKWGHGERENLRPKQAVRGESVPGAALCTVAALLHDSGTLGRVVQDIRYLRAPSPVNVSHALSEGMSPPSERSQRGSQALRPLLRPRTKILCAAGVRAEHVHAIVASCQGYGGTKWGAQLLSAPVPLPRVDATLAAAAFNPRASVLRPRGCRSLHSAQTTLHPYGRAARRWATVLNASVTLTRAAAPLTSSRHACPTPFAPPRRSLFARYGLPRCQVRAEAPQGASGGRCLSALSALPSSQWQGLPHQRAQKSVAHPAVPSPHGRQARAWLPMSLRPPAPASRHPRSTHRARPSRRRSVCARPRAGVVRTTNVCAPRRHVCGGVSSALD